MAVKKNFDLSTLGKTLSKATEQKREIPSAMPSAPEVVRVGRKKKLSTRRENAVTVYLTDEMMEALNEIKYNNRVERQRVIQASVSEMLKRYYDLKEKALSREGFEMVRKFEEELMIDG